MFLAMLQLLQVSNCCVETRRCSVPDNDIASTGHMAKTEGYCRRAPNVHLAATFALQSLRITPGALRNTTIAHLARGSNDDLDPVLPLRRGLHLLHARAKLPLLPADTHATKSSLSALQLPSRHAQYLLPSAFISNNTKQLS